MPDVRACMPWGTYNTKRRALTAAGDLREGARLGAKTADGGKFSGTLCGTLTPRVRVRSNATERR